MDAVHELQGQTVVVIGGTSGIGLATARRARAAGADVIITARNEDRLRRIADELGARTAAFDVTDFDQVTGFFVGLADPIDHVLVTGPGPSYATVDDFDVDAARRDLDVHLLLHIKVAQLAGPHVRPTGTLLFMGTTGARRTEVGTSLASALSAAQPALTKSLALELAPVRVNLIAAGFVNTPLSAKILGDDLAARLDELRTTLPVHRVIGPEDIAALAIHLMENTALTGATFDIDGGQQLLPG